jgi:mannose/fructose/N-acetylgalactosamine-specific phosphotransferase system component IIB
LSIALFRVDERLIHGQVTVGWGTRIHPVRYLVVDDILAESGWEQDLYRLGVPSEAEVHFLGVSAAAAELEAWDQAAGSTVLLTRDLPSMARLASEAGLVEGEVNLGGIHQAPGREVVLPYLALGEPERTSIRELLDAGLDVVARDLPGAAGVNALAFVEDRE